MRLVKQKVSPSTLTLIALMAALVYIFTRVVQIPTPTKGYVHLGDGAIVFTALAFGPLVGGIAGGLGTALADLFSGYGAWAPFSLIIHGLQGYLLGRLMQRNRLSWKRMIGLTLISIAVVAGGYALAGLVLVGTAALIEIPANMLQALSGSLLGIPLYYAVSGAYPLLRRYQA